jgi:hypothetical protein
MQNQKVRLFFIFVAKIHNNKNEFKELMKKIFSRPHPLSPSPQMWNGGTKGGEVKRPNFVLYGESNPYTRMCA